jgi:hypothetical protein
MPKHMLMAAGSIVGSFVGGRLLGLVPSVVLLPSLTVILVISAAKVRRHQCRISSDPAQICSGLPSISHVSAIVEFATSTDLSIRQIQAKIAGRASRTIVGEITNWARFTVPAAL